VELRHLRYFLAVGEALNFTKAAARLRIAQPALSRQIQDLEDEIGVDLLRRSPRGVMLTAEGKLFLAEVRELLKRCDESVERVRALARGEYGELHIGYVAIPTVEIDRVALRDRLATDKITIDWAYDPPLHLQPVFQRTMGTRPGMLPRSESLLTRHICLPVHARMRDEDAEFVAQRLLTHVRNLSSSS